jgi:hypothetical protein
VAGRRGLALGKIGEGVDESCRFGVIGEALFPEFRVIIAIGENGVVANKVEDIVDEVRSDESEVELDLDDEEGWD